MVDHRLKKTMRIPGTTPVVAAMMATMATAMMTLARPPVQAPQDPRDLLVVVHRIFRHCAQSR
jgi:hypothetical protein